MTLSITPISDLHLDFGKTTPELPGGKILVLAGDVCEARNIRPYNPDLVTNDVGLSLKQRIAKFLLEQCSEKYEHVLYVPGNHEHYHGVFDTTIKKMRENLPANFRVLDNETFEIGNVLFLGATLWTDCNRNDPLTMHAVRDLMNDFSVIRKIRCGDYAKFSPQDTINENWRTMQYFKMILEMPHNIDKKIVVITHHAPTSLSIVPQYAGQFLMNGAYHSRLDDFILDNPRIALWVHGHMHSRLDYKVGDYTRVVCNPRGYHGNSVSEETDWDPGFTIEV